MSLRARSVRDWTATLAVLVAVAGVFVGLYFGARRLEDERTRTEFEAAASARIRAATFALQSDLRLLRFSVLDFKALLATRVPTLPTFLSIVTKELHAFAGELMAEERDVSLVSFLLHVPDEGRAAFEAQARQLVAPGFEIYEIDAQGESVAAGTTEDHHVVVATLPIEMNTLLGMDLASTPGIRDALEAARDRDALAATEPLSLRPREPPVVWIAGAIYHSSPPPATPELRRSQLAGFILMGLVPERIFEESFTGLYPSGVDMVLTDETDPAQPRTLAVHSSRTRTGPEDAALIERDARTGPLTQSAVLDLADRSWRITASPAPAFFGARPRWPTRIILVVGLVLAILSAASVRLAVSRRLQVQRLVEERTADLTREIREKERIETQLKATEKTLVARIADLDRRAAEFQILNRMGEMMQRCSTSEEALSVVTRFCSELFPLATGTLYRYDEALRSVERATGWGTDAISEPVFTVDRCWALRGGTPHAVEDPTRDLWCPHLRADPDRSSLCLPLTAQGQTIGLLHLAGPRFPLPEGSPPLSTRRDLAITVADQVSPALANIRLREILREQSVRDPLTGLYNRRYMEESVHQALHRAQRTASPVCVIMIDIDHFKRFNDEHGHETGDTLLRTLGSFLRGELRESDTPCRYGGEEFTIIMPDATPEIGRQRAERIRERAGQLKVSVGKEEHRGITLSLGVAAYPEHGKDRDTLIEAADAALYRAKREGRDRVVLAQA